MKLKKNNDFKIKYFHQLRTKSFYPPDYGLRLYCNTKLQMPFVLYYSVNKTEMQNESCKCNQGKCKCIHNKCKQESF